MADSRFYRGMEVLRKVDPALADSLSAMLEPRIDSGFSDSLSAKPDATMAELARYAVEFGYGDILSRPGLGLRTRELLTVAMLGVMGTATLQLEMHVRSALEVGATKEELVEVILQVAVYAGFPAAFNAMLLLDKALTSTSI